MIKTEPKLKELTIDDKANIIETVSDYIVCRDNTGVVKYMPYIRNYAFTVAIALYAIDGVEFEEDDNVYDIATNDKDIDILFESFCRNIPLLKEINGYIDDIVEFKKNYIIHNNQMINDKIIEILDNQKAFEDYRYKLAIKENKILNQQIESNIKQLKAMKKLSTEELESLYKKMASGEYDQNKIANAVVKSYMDAGLVKSTPDKTKVINIENKKNPSTSYTPKQKNRQNRKNNNISHKNKA